MGQDANKVATASGGVGAACGILTCYYMVAFAVTAAAKFIRRSASPINP